MIHIYAVLIGLVIFGVIYGIFYLKEEYPDVLNKIVTVIVFLLLSYVVGIIVIAIYLNK